MFSTSGNIPVTWVTAFAYGALAVASYFYFKSRKASRANFIGFGIIATLVYDATSLAAGLASRFGEQRFVGIGVVSAQLKGGGRIGAECHKASILTGALHAADVAK